MIRDSEFSDTAVDNFIRTDSIGRNEYLNQFISGLISIEHNTYISVDANWGAGKTVFMKQLEYLSYCSLDNLNAPNLDIQTISKFQDKFVVFYYNAWKSDFHEDPLQSMLFSMIDAFYSDDKRKDKVKALAKQTVKSIAKEALKSLTKGIIDIEKISDIETVDDLVSGINDVDERRQAIISIVGKILPDNKKLLFVIDELDRCNPEFAVRVLEVAKHYYDSENIVFVLSTNNRQLVHTVKKYYGNDFNGYGYLDKLYDLIVDLPPIDLEKYFLKQLNIPSNGEWINIIPIGIAKHFDMTMREANRYIALYSFIKGGISKNVTWHGRSTVPLLTSFVFVPLALALKIRNINLYDDFISGRGEDIIRNLYNSNEMFLSIQTERGRDEDDALEVAINAYKSMINAKSLPHDQSNYQTKEAEEFFRQTLPLISSVGKIDGQKDPEE